MIIQVVSMNSQSYINEFKQFRMYPPELSVTLPEIKEYIEGLLRTPTCKKIEIKKFE